MMQHFSAKYELKSLTSLRFVAAFYVFLFHVDARAPLFGEGTFGTFIAEGAVGMTIFFVLSGFILSHAYQSVKFDLRQFFWNRIARIYPIYILAAALALPWLIKDLWQESSLTNPIFAIFFGVILIVTGLILLQAWLPQAFGFWNNSASWSISNEAFFYSVFPFTQKLIVGLHKKKLLTIFVTLSLLSAMIPTSAIVFSNAPDSFALFYALPIFRLPEFLCGMIAYRLVCGMQFNNRSRYTLFVIIILSFLHVALLGKVLPGYTLHNWIVISGVAASLALLYDAAQKGGGFFENTSFVWLGKISYCFYSFQFHVLGGFLWLLPPDEFGALSYTLISTVVLLAISAFAYHFVEEPARIWIRDRTSRARFVGETQ